MKQSKETLKQFFETGDKPTQQQYSDLIDSYIDAKQMPGEPNRRFMIDENGDVQVASELKTPEYTLSEIIANKLSLLKDGVVVKEIDLTNYLDDTNLSRLVSGTVDPAGMATFERDDSSTFTVDFSNIVGGGSLNKLNDLQDVTVEKQSVYFLTQNPDGNETRGYRNIVLGNAGVDGVGDDNIILGEQAGNGLGNDAANGNHRNVLVGVKAGSDLAGGTDNTIIGFESGKTNRFGNNNILIGSRVDTESTGDSNKLNIGNIIKGDVLSHKIGLNGVDPLEDFHIKGVMRHETSQNKATLNSGIAEFYDQSNISNIFYHLKLPYKHRVTSPYHDNEGHSRWHIHITGSSNGSRTAIDLRCMGFLFSPNGIRNSSETIVHNNPDAGIGVLGAGSYISDTDNRVVIWFQLSNSNLTRFRVDSMIAGTGQILSKGDIGITASVNSRI
ncbi:hypothetical protein SAMN04489761_2811 [Tenacibaculum sp. MAR_2009_124]|uniref:hypothetical protein n=1 Tax=Tenacibaculum sp. MAR_2009_124 TaxID=1250059 RepID=UPI00089C3261|nr:hypothetical protein [Tenacibaculum sp. MAR_2009_124]SEC37345.1 hypothetical protein SAMN04489761_2811 [Tenacibaculum sp. MAR_2009_124]